MLDSLSRILPLPYPHFMGFAPLDAWWRVLTRDRAYAKIPVRFWPRIVGGLCTSALGTVLTLPERLLLAPFLPSTRRTIPSTSGIGAADRPLTRLGSENGPIFILGYYRSGTTHLHYLLSCDPNLSTPRWYQMLAPQGFALSWTFLRYFLVPFLSSSRPQDDVAYGPEYPAEDDFGICNWSGACAMPGRMIVPASWEHYKRYHTLEGLSTTELEAFRRTQLALTWKLSRLSGGRTLLLKTPSHTARVAELARLYPNSKFIHLHRDPTPVLRSNVALHQRFAPFLFQPYPGDDEIRRRVIEEYDRTERKFLDESAALPPDRVVRLRYEDLIADPLAQLRAAYIQLNLNFAPDFDRRARVYLDSVRNYRAAAEKPTTTSTDNRATIAPAPELSWMHEAFGHNQPAIPAAPSHSTSDIPHPTSDILLTPVTAALIAACFSFAAWMAIAAIIQNRLDFLAWPVGVAIGLSALKSAGTHNRRGTTALGLWSLLLTLIVILAAAYPATWLAVRTVFSPDNLSHHVWLATRRGVLAWNNIIWIVLGLTTAYRYASRQHVRPPGL